MNTFTTFAENVSLLVYNAKDGEILKYDNVTIKYRKHPFDRSRPNQYYAFDISQSKSKKRLVSQIENDVYYCPSKNSYAVWNFNGDYETMMKFIQYHIYDKSYKECSKSLDRIKAQYAILSTAKKLFPNDDDFSKQYVKIKQIAGMSLDD